MGMLKNVRMEYSKVQWPGKNEVITATLWVVVMSIFLGIYLGVFDLAASRLIKMLVSLFGG
ncbi:MAG: preprotein translocase subunit SecE [Cetobacterium sp.]|uniref:preprotein translocase subunit SecE n=1 Tax=Cetobacterium sp. 2A TaxID=2754723 RepID=UPI00163B9445|nr:preprotein translocase subunit SecE [Cetobacterium sp. 2A]MBC2856283.1 preprotein translocase subunit SecE [Cetobacterium sp. 2A]